MKMRKTGLLSVFLMMLTICCIGTVSWGTSDLTKTFVCPPSQARPWVYFWWMDHMSRESITRDMEALKAKGVGGMVLFQCDGGLLPKEVFGEPQLFWSPQWNEKVKFAAAEAKRLGLGFILNYVGTSTGCGGPWIPVEKSAKTLVWSGSWVKGGQNVTVQMPQPQSCDNFYRDVAVVAYPCPKERDAMRAAAPEIKASIESPHSGDPEYAFDGDEDTYWFSGTGTEGGERMDISFGLPFTASGLVMISRAGVPSLVDVQISDDGAAYKSVSRQNLAPDKPLKIEFGTVTSRFYRIQFQASQSIGGRVGIAELRLLAPGEDGNSIVSPFKHFSEQVARSHHSPAGLSAQFRGGDITEDGSYDSLKSKVINLTAKMDEQGVLRWDAPEGNWMIIRFGITAIGFRGRIGGYIKERGYHADFLDPAAVQKHFADGVDPMLKAIGYTPESGLMALHEDSFETPFNQWTSSFAEEFKKRRGYDLTPWLPVLVGRVVESRGASERFLWDYRRTIADLYATHWKTAQKLCAERGLKFEAEAAGPSPYCFDALAQLGRTDIPMGEFWSGIYQPGLPVDEQHRGCWNSPVCETIRQTASAAHLYGKPIIAAESFTGYARPFVLDPFDVKAFGDRALCDGLNRFVVHLFMTQPLEEYKGKPVVVRLHAFDYNRRTTWFEQSRFWTDYLARCSAMLQAGQPAADVCCFLGEGAPALVPQREFMEPRIPAGYDYDACNAELLLRATVHNGRVRFPSGVSYALLTLHPQTKSITPEMMRHIRRLVKDGATLLGPKPQYSPSLADYERADRDVRAIADELWGKETPASGEHAFGKGRVLWGKTVAETLAAVKCEPACTIQGADSILFAQRHTDEGEVFFLSQQDKTPVDFTASFRVAHSVIPEVWDPADGSREAIAVFRQSNGRIEIPMHLDERGSAFVVLRPGQPDKHLISASHEMNKHDFRVIYDNKDLKLITRVPGKFTLSDNDGHVQTLTVPSVSAATDLSADWSLTFEGLGKTVNMKKLISWTKLEPEDMRNYSGTVTYRKQFTWPQSGNGRVELNLGSFKNIAEVFLNGKSAGLLWKPPYRLDITSFVKPGDNELEIKITNLLVNRITADYNLPEEQKHLCSFGAIEQYRPGVESGQDGLLPSGLFGPVIILQPAEVTIAANH